jgi:hypothetical protein
LEKKRTRRRAGKEGPVLEIARLEITRNKDKYTKKKEDVRYRKVWKRNERKEGQKNKEQVQEIVLSGIVVQDEFTDTKKEVRVQRDVDVIENFASPHATCLDGLSISLCRLEVPFCTFQSQKSTFFHIYAPYQLDNKHIRRLLHYNPRTSGLVLKIKNYVRFPCHVTRSMILDLPYTETL